MRLEVEIPTRSLILVHGIISLSHSQTCSQFHKVEGGDIRRTTRDPVATKTRAGQHDHTVLAASFKGNNTKQASAMS